MKCMLVVCKHAKPRGVELPPENFEKFHPLRLNMRAFLMIYSLYSCTIKRKEAQDCNLTEVIA